MDINEQWKDVNGFEGMYMIGNHGTLLSNKRGCWRIMSITNKNGWYLSIRLKDRKGKYHTKRIHHLVYEAFVGDIPAGYDVHHKDGNKQNNCVENLLAISENEHHTIHASENPNIYEGMRYYNKYVKTIPIFQYSLDGTFIAEYPNGHEAHIATGVCQRNILQVAHKTEYKPGKIRKQAGGYIWKLKEQD